MNISRISDRNGRVSINSDLYQTSCPAGAFVELAVFQEDVFQAINNFHKTKEAL